MPVKGKLHRVVRLGNGLAIPSNHRLGVNAGDQVQGQDEVVDGGVTVVSVSRRSWRGQ